MTATSPYLNAAARRASIQCVTLRAPVYATTNEWQHRFSRGISDGIPLEKTPAIEPLWKAWAAAALTFLTIAIFVVIT